MRTAIGLRSKAMAVHHLQKHGSFCHFVAGSCAVLYTEFTRETMRLHPPEESNLRWDRDLPPALGTGTWGPYIAKIRTAKRVWKEKALQFTHPGEKTGRVQLLDVLHSLDFTGSSKPNNVHSFFLARVGPRQLDILGIATLCFFLNVLPSLLGTPSYWFSWSKKSALSPCSGPISPI